MTEQDPRTAPAPKPAPRRIPEWIRRRDEGKLQPKDMTGAVAL